MIFLSGNSFIHQILKFPLCDEELLYLLSTKFPLIMIFLVPVKQIYQVPIYRIPFSIGVNKCLCSIIYIFLGIDICSNAFS